MEKENVLQKIQKLLKLQFNAEKIGSSGEAFQAAKMVKKLLMEYNLSMSDISTDGVQESVKMTKTEDITSGSSYGNHWKFQLLGVIAMNNLCQAYRRISGKMFVVGTPENTVVVNEFYQYLVTVFRRLAEERWAGALKDIEKVHGPRLKTEESDEAMEKIRRKYIRSYLEGVPYGLQENYDSLKPTSAETALTACHNAAINDYVKNNFEWNEKRARRTTRHVYGDAFNLGQEDGRKVSLNRQITKKITEGLLF